MANHDQWSFYLWESGGFYGESSIDYGTGKATQTIVFLLLLNHYDTRIHIVVKVLYDTFVSQKFYLGKEQFPRFQRIISVN